MTLNALGSVTTNTSPSSDPQPTRQAQPEELTQFLSLLTTQIQNQDPLEPLDSTGFVEQLATFSALEQQVQTNDHLASILALLSATGPDDPR